MEAAILQMRTELLNGTPKDELKTKYPTLSDKKHFWNMITSREIDTEILSSLIVLLEGIESNEFSENDASIMFGEVLVNKFVKGKVKE